MRPIPIRSSRLKLHYAKILLFIECREKKVEIDIVCGPMFDQLFLVDQFTTNVETRGELEKRENYGVAIPGPSKIFEGEDIVVRATYKRRSSSSMYLMIVMESIFPWYEITLIDGKKGKVG